MKPFCGKLKRKSAMDDDTKTTIREIEAHSRFPTGIGQIERGECSCGGVTPMACMFCPYGHMLECHFPHTCEEVECNHYQREMEAEFEP